MLKRLQDKWKVSPGRLLLILATFALGGSLTGYVGRKILLLLHPHQPALFAGLYIILVTLLWPLIVLLVSIPFGQFFFFKAYIYKLAKNLRRSQSKRKLTDPKPAPFQHNPQILHVKRIAIFASGAGSNAQQIINYFRGSATVQVALIVCNKPDAGVIAIAQKEGIPLLPIEKERFFKGDGYLPGLQEAKTDLIVLAGFLWKIPQTLIDAFPRRIINIHPALLPKYGGKGMYGSYVHQSVLNAGEVESGITIHYVDEHYDNGDIIFQTALPLLEGDTPETLAKRINQLEHLHYPVVIEDVIKKLI